MNTDPSKNILVLRFSSLGDLGLLYPALIAFLNQHPDHTITLVTRIQFASLFQDIQRLQVYAVDLRKYKGITGLASLAGILNKSVSFTKVVDAHSVLRTHILSLFLRVLGKKVNRLNKPRKLRQGLVKRKNKDLRQLPHITEQYLQIFRDAGYNVKHEPGPYVVEETYNDPVGEFSSDNKKWIGFAPFSKWETKILPLNKSEELLSALDESGRFNLLVFGSLQEIESVKHWKNKYSFVSLNENPGDFVDEIHLMKKLSLMISMDSANMHLAALAGIPVLTIWGSTHRYNG